MRHDNFDLPLSISFMEIHESSKCIKYRANESTLYLDFRRSHLCGSPGRGWG
jgi:hypothetical protein